MNDSLNITEEQEKERIRNKAILKGKVTLIIFIFILLVVAGIVFIIIKIATSPKKEPEKPKIVLGEVTAYRKVNDSINFIDKNSNTVYTYKCMHSNCNEAKVNYNGFEDLKDIKTMLIEDDSKYVLYNYKKGIIVSSYYEKIDIVKENDNTKYFIYKNYGLYGILNPDGTVKIDPQYHMLYLDNYNTISNYVLFSKEDGKKGIIDYTNNSIIIPNLYDDILLYDNYFVGKINNESYLLNYNNKQIYNNSYDSLYIFDKCVVTIKNNELFIKDYSETNLHEEPIKTYLNSPDDNLISIDNSIIRLVIYKYVEGSTTDKEAIEYEFNTNNSILTKK